VASGEADSLLGRHESFWEISVRRGDAICTLQGASGSREDRMPSMFTP